MAIQCSHDNRTYEIGHIDELIQALRLLDANQTVALVCGDPNELTTLFARLKELTPSLVCSLQWFLKQSTQIKPAYAWQRQQFIIENQQRVEKISHNDVVVDSVKSTIGKTPNWISRNGNANGMLQQQLQHRQQHQQQQEKITRPSDTHNSAVVKERVVEAFFTPIDVPLPDVITRDNIEQSLGGFYASLPPKSNRPSLTDIWDNLVGGVGAQSIQDKRKTITGVTPDVMKLIIHHYDSFFYSVNTNNLPVVVNEFGRALKRVELCGHEATQQYVLRFTNDPTVLTNIDRFTLLLRCEFSHGKNEWVRAEFKRPEEDDWLALLPAESDEAEKTALRQAFTTLKNAPNVEQAQQACLKILSLVAAKDKTDLLTRELTKFQQSFKNLLMPNHYRYLADMCVYGGVESVLFFLNTVTTSADKSAFLPFFDEPSNWQQWATKLGLTKLLAASKLEARDAVWWQALITQHKDARAPMHFNVLFDAFDDFSAKIRVDKDTKLPAQFPFKGVRHLQPALQRLLYIVQNSSEKNQINLLMNIGLGALQDYYGMYFEQMTSVSAEMALDPDSALLQLQDGQSSKETWFSFSFANQRIFKASMDLETRHAQFMSTKKISRNIQYPDTVKFYYRYIARPLVGNIKNRGTYVQIQTNIDNLSLNLTPKDNGPGLFFVLGDENTTPDLPSTHLSGYMCVRDGSGNPIALYFFDRHDPHSPRRFNMDIPLKGILSRLRSDKEHLNPGELSDIAEHTQFTPIQGDQHISLSDSAKASLLYVCAVAGSGLRARNQSALPADELKEFLQALKESADKASMSYEELIAYIHHEVDLNEDTTPTLGELATLLKRIPIETITEDKSAYLKKTLQSTLTFVTRFGENAFRIFEDYQTRLERCTKENHPNGYLPYHIFIDQFNCLYQCLGSVEPELLLQLSPVLALLKNVADIDEASLKQLLKTTEQLEPKLKQNLLTLLYDINLQTTNTLPEFAALLALIKSLKGIQLIDEEDDQDKDRANVMTKNGLKNCIQESTPYCLGRGPMQKMTINLVEVFKKFTSHPQYDKLHKLVEPYQSWINGAGLGSEVAANIEGLKQFKTLLNANPTEESVLTALKDIDRNLETLMATAKSKLRLLIPIIQSAAKSFAPKSAEQIDKFFEKPGLGVFAPAFFDDYCTPTLRQQLKDLQIGSSTSHAFVKFNADDIGLLASVLKDQAFQKVREKLKDPQNALLTTDEVASIRNALQSAKEKKSDCQNLQKKLVDTFESYILAQIRPENLDGTTVEIAQRYGETCEHVANFLNSLIRLRNSNPESFRLCLDKLLHNQLYQTFKFQDVARLFDVLSQFDERIPVQQQLTLILSDLQNAQSPGDPKQLKQVLDGLQALSEDQAHLDSDEALLTYFKDSVTHNFRSTQPFNFKGEINIQKMCQKLDLKAQDAKLFRQAVSRAYSMLKKTDMDIANQFLEYTEQKLEGQMPDALPFMLLLLESIQTKDDWSTYSALLAAIPSDKLALSQWKLIFSADTTMHELTLSEIEQIVKRLKTLDKAALSSMCDILFACEPYPEKTAFINALTNDDPDALSRFQEEFDRHPYGLENWEKMKHSFNTDRVIDVIGGIRHLLNNQPLSEAEQIDLKRQFDYINALGKPDSPYKLRPVNRDGQLYPLITADGKEHSEISLRTCSRRTLKELANHLIQEFYVAEQASSSPDCLSARAHRQLTLQLLAVMRESYYRATGRVPNSTQMLSLIYSLDYPERQLFGIRTGEGKSITTALFSGLLCAKGGTVYVPTANRTLVRQDYIEKHNRRFFSLLGFASSQIDNNSEKAAHHVGGIHYGADGDLANFFSKASLKGWNLFFHKKGCRYPLFMVKDEYDYSMDDRTQFRFAISKDPLHQDKSPYEWVYEAANVFVKDKREAFYKTKESFSEEEYALQFKRFLEVTAEASQANIEEKKNHILQWLPQLSDLLDCAADAVDYVEGTDFFITSQDEEGHPLGHSIAVPFNANGVPQWGGTFADSRHACLHALLNAKYPGRLYRFPIDPEQICIASKSSMGFMRLFRVVIGLTGTPGSDEELLEQQDKNGMFATEFPPHKPGNRKELPPLIVKEDALDDTILDAILLHTWYNYPLPMIVIRVLDRILSFYRTTLQYLYASLGYAPMPEKPQQPILVVVKNKNKAEALYDKLEKKLGKDRVQKITGEETHADRTALLEKAAEDGMTTIGTPLVGRGTDFEPTHSLVVFQTFMDTLRNTLQIMGRTARKGLDGTSGAIYADTEIRFFDWLSMLFGPSIAQRKEQISKKQTQLNQEVAVQRYYLQEVDEIQQVIFEQFDAWMSVFLGETGERRASLRPDDPVSEASLLRQRGKLIQLLNDAWQKRLQAVTPEGLSNPYVYWVDGVLNTEHLNKALKDKNNQGFESDVLQIWQDFADDLKAKVECVNLAQYSHKDKARLERLKTDDMHEVLQYRKLNLHRKRLNKTVALEKKQADQRRTLELASNEAFAVHYYDNQHLSPTEQAHVLKTHAETYLKHVFDRLPPALKYLNQDEPDIFKRYIQLINKLEAAETLKKETACQQTAFECIAFYQAIEVNSQFLFSKEDDFAVKVRISSLRKQYAQQLLINLTDDLQFGWAKHVLYRNVESTQVLKAMEAIQKQIVQPITAEYPLQQKMADLQQILTQYQQQLNRMRFYFPWASYLFGYPDPKKVIDNALIQMNILAKFEHYSEHEQAINREIGQCRAYFSGFLKEIETLSPDNSADQGWNYLKRDLKAMYADANDGFAVVDMLMSRLSSIPEDSNIRIKLGLQDRMRGFFAPISTSVTEHLKDHLKMIRKKIRQDHPGYDDPLCGELFLSRRETQLKRSLNRIIYGATNRSDVYQSMHLEVKAGHTGFEPYYEVIIHSEQCDLIEVSNFIRDPRRARIEKALVVAQSKLKEVTEQLESALAKEAVTRWKATVSRNKQKATSIANALPAKSPSHQWNQLFRNLGWAYKAPVTVDSHPVNEKGVGKKFFSLSSLFKRSHSQPVLQNTMTAAEETSGDTVIVTPDSMLTENIKRLKTQQKEYQADVVVLGERLAMCSSNLMSRRFETLGELLGFEAELKARAEALPPTPVDISKECVESVITEESDVSVSINSDEYELDRVSSFSSV